jgi:hypothetical protein
MIYDQPLFDESELRPQYNLLLSTDTTPAMNQLAIIQGDTYAQASICFPASALPCPIRWCFS